MIEQKDDPLLQHKGQWIGDGFVDGRRILVFAVKEIQGFVLMCRDDGSAYKPMGSWNVLRTCWSANWRSSFDRRDCVAVAIANRSREQLVELLEKAFPEPETEFMWYNG